MNEYKPINVTPTLSDTNSVQPFRFWCQKVLPLVYDDSLSYYELLCKVVDYLNKAIQDTNTLAGNVTNLHSAFSQLQQFVNDYFGNLNVQEEINNKLDELVTSGRLDLLLQTFIPYVTPEMFGAVGDGKHDDYPSLQECFSSGNFISLSPNKIYAISQPLTISKSNVVLNGNGSTITLLNDVQNVYTVISVGTSSTNNNIYISNLFVDSNATRSNINIQNSVTGSFNACLAFQNYNNIFVEKCSFSSGGVWGIFCGYSSNKPITSGFNLSDCEFSSYIGTSTSTFVDTSCLYIQSKNVTIVNNKFVGTVNNETAIELHNNCNHVVGYNNISTYHKGIIVINEDNNLEQHSSIVSNNIYNVEIGVSIWSSVKKNINSLRNIDILSNSIFVTPNLRGSIAGICGGVCVNRTTDSYSLSSVNVIDNVITQLNSVSTTNAGYLTNITGISFDALNTSFSNICIKNNKISNTNGIAIVLHSTSPSFNEICNNTIINPCYDGTISEDESINLVYTAIRCSNVIGFITNNNIISNVKLYRPVIAYNSSAVISNEAIYNNIVNQFAELPIIKINADSSTGEFSFTTTSEYKETDNLIYYSTLITLTSKPNGYAIYLTLPFTTPISQNIPCFVSTEDNVFICRLFIRPNNTTAYIYALSSALTANMLDIDSKIFIHSTIYKN